MSDHFKDQQYRVNGARKGDRGSADEQRRAEAREQMREAMARTRERDRTWT